MAFKALYAEPGGTSDEEWPLAGQGEDQDLAEGTSLTSPWTQVTRRTPEGLGSWFSVVGQTIFSGCPESRMAVTALTFTLTARVGASCGNVAWRAQSARQGLSTRGD